MKKEVFEATKYWGDHKIFDIASNLLDESFDGKYFGKKQHEPDFHLVVNRARKYGIRKFIFSASSLYSAKFSQKLASIQDDFYATLGVHPSSARDALQGDCMRPEEERINEYFDRLKAMF